MSNFGGWGGGRSCDQTMYLNVLIMTFHFWVKTALLLLNTGQEGINRAWPPHLSQANSSVSLLPHAATLQHAAMLPCVSMNFISILTLLRTDELSIFDLTHCAGRWSCLHFRKLESDWVLLMFPAVLFFWIALVGATMAAASISTHSRRGIWSEVEFYKT